jgi:5-hydroxyisourate hydrolase
MTTLSTHVLDTSLGRPAAGINVTLERVNDPRTASAGGTLAVTTLVGRGVTDENGRLANFTSAGETLEPATYSLTFHVGDYLRGTARDVFFPEVTVRFVVRDTEEHYHIPLLLSPFGYSTYRGS